MRITYPTFSRRIRTVYEVIAVIIYSNRLRINSILILAVIGVYVGATVPVSAMSAAQRSIYKMGVLYYDDQVQSCSGAAGSVTTASGLPDDIVKNINDLKPTYQKVADATGVPWQLLAAIHYRESNNDPDRDLQAGNPFGGPYSQQSSDYAKYGHPKDLEQSVEIVAEHLISVQKSGVVNKEINIPSPDAEEVKDVLFSYNGRAQQYADQAAALGFSATKQPYEGSPYVMNNYDSVHQNMKIITRDNGPLDGVDTRFGAFAVYAKLGGATTSSSNGCVSSANMGNIAAKAIEYAWPTAHNSPFLERNPAYNAAITKALQNGSYTGPTDPLHAGIDCGGFVTRVMQDSGADPGYNPGMVVNGVKLQNVVGQQAYLNAHPEKYENLGTNPGTLQPGDIAIISTHTFIYVGPNATTPDGKKFDGDIAEASYGGTGGPWWAPMAHHVYYQLNGEKFTWYRLKQ